VFTRASVRILDALRFARLCNALAANEHPDQYQLFIVLDSTSTDQAPQVLSKNKQVVKFCEATPELGVCYYISVGEVQSGGGVCWYAQLPTCRC
jgi:GT2 family glycosyltransferase